MQITSHPILGENRSREIIFYLNGERMTAREGQTIAAALIGNGIMKYGVSRKLQQPRGLFCGTGRCYSCFMTVNDLDHVLTCMTPVEEGMNVFFNDKDPIMRGV